MYGFDDNYYTLKTIPKNNIIVKNVSTARYGQYFFRFFQKLWKLAEF